MCDDYPVKCPNNCQEEPLKGREIESHLENDCPFTLVGCPLQYTGCEAQFPCKDMPEHMKDTATHLTLLASFTRDLLKENVELRESMKVKDQQHKELLQATQEEVHQLKRDLTRYLGFPKVYPVKHSSAEEQMYLPAFYTHTHGYKMCLQVFPNGFNNGNGTHVSIFTCLMKGLHDDHQKWPFRGEVTIQIVNQA